MYPKSRESDFNWMYSNYNRQILLAKYFSSYRFCSKVVLDKIHQNHHPNLNSYSVVDNLIKFICYPRIHIHYVKLIVCNPSNHLCVHIYFG